jgi:hypothetical protein
MNMRPFSGASIGLVLSTFLVGGTASGQTWQASVTVKWDKVQRISRTTPTYQIVNSALMRRTSPIHDQVYLNIRNLGAEYVRFQTWYPFPLLSVAELEPPSDGKTHWDFSGMDPIVVDFLEAAKGHKIILNLSTIPQWMFKTDKPVPYPADPDALSYDYSQGTELRDPSLKEAADYFARLASWYTQGGFKDEYGQWHASGHHYKIDYWEVLNETDFEHGTTPETYTVLYDAIVEAILKVAPEMKFVSLAAGATSIVPLEAQEPRLFEYFLDSRNHKPGIPIDMISYHFYAQPGEDEPPSVQQFTVFNQADRFLSLVKFVELIRQRLSPQTRTALNEIGIISADDSLQDQPGHVSKPIPDSYWNLSAAMFSYMYNQLSHLGIEAVGMSSGLAYPNTYYPSVTMMDWKTGQPNARYRALKLLIDNSGPGDKQVETRSRIPMSPWGAFIDAQAYITSKGQRKILLINKRDRPFEVAIEGIKGATEERVDQETNFRPAVSGTLDSDKVLLKGFAVSVITLRD